MLALWMFGVELERRWGSRFFLKYYLMTGIGAALTTLALALAPGPFGDAMRDTVTVGASGAIYGLLLAYALYFPDRPIYLWALFPIPAKYFVMIMGAIAFMSSVGGDRGGVANTRPSRRARRRVPLPAGVAGTTHWTRSSTATSNSG